jgi:putative membrane protein
MNRLMTQSRPLRGHLLALTALVLTSASASAQETRSHLSSSDKAFVTATARANNYQVAAAKLAQTKAASADHKRYAQTALDDHTKVAERLHSTVAEADASVTLPTELDATGRKRLDKLNTAPNFDAEYKRQMIASHDEMHASFTSYAKRPTANSALKQVVVDLLPTLQSHRDMSRKLP